MKTIINKGLLEWEKIQIKDAFTRCFGLKECLIKRPNDTFHELARQSGLSETFIRENIEEIKTF